MSEPKEEIFFLVRIILPVLIIILIIIQTLVAFQNNKLLKQFTEKENVMEEKETQISLEEALELILKQISGIKEENVAVRRAVNGLYTRKRDEQIITMLNEKFINDYTGKGLEYFLEADYKNAQNAFNAALLYQNDNTSVMFLKTYCSYLNLINDVLTEEERNELVLNTRELKEKGFKEAEIIYFSISEMEKIINEMEFNLNLVNTERVSNEKE